MPKLGLALSGGGFRATLYHLGVVRFLRDVGALGDVTDIASVSGGSILAAHLVLNWDRYNGSDEQFAEASADILRFVQFDVRNHIVRRLPFQYPMRLLAKLAGRQNRKFTPNEILEHYYQKYLYGDRCLYELPEQPMLHLLATSVSNGALSAFNRDGLFIQERDNGGKTFDHVPGALATISRVVSASSAFPGFFPPVEISAADLGVRDGQFPTDFFTDGGVYDNLGLRAFSWLNQQQQSYDNILVSDAGKPFQILSEAALGLVGQSLRASDILWDRVWQLERENFGCQDGFVFLPITNSVTLSEDATAVHPVIQVEVPTIRTDLDRFSTHEVNALAQHGYQVTRKVCRERGVLGDAQFPDSPPWQPIPADESTRQQSGAESYAPSVTTRLSRQLRKSSRRRIWSTFLDWRDWPSYVYLTLAFALLILLPLQIYQLYRKSQLQGIVIDAIAEGDPEVRQILNLVTSDPSSGWMAEEVREKTQATELDYEGVEILTHSRIYDLRRWYPEETSPSRRGHIYVRDRITLKLLDSYKGDGRIIFRIPTSIKGIQFRQPNKDSQGNISRIAEPIQLMGRERTLYEFEYDLSHVPPEEPVTVEVELMGEVSRTVRAPFLTHANTDLISVWMLFPENRPYRSYSLVSYPLDRSEPTTIMNSRYAIDHPYGYLIGWSVVNPADDRVYECRWAND